MEIHDMACLRATVLATTAVGLMALATPAFAEVIMTPDGHYYKLIPLKAPPRDGPRPHASPWPIYNGFDHQPTENELRALHEQDVTPAQADEIDKLYDQLMSADRKILGSHPKLP
jgi:Spy/CpxP family protein refolding chaperone